MRLSHFEFGSTECHLPFAVGGATQHKPHASQESRNSQDALTIRVAETAIVAAVADGCSGTHPRLEASCESGNEVGAKLLAYIVAEEASSAAMLLDRYAPERWLSRLNKIVTKRMRSLVACVVPRNAAKREMFVFDFLMTTLVGFVVTPNVYIIFHCGDGVIGLNGHIQRLEESAGHYIANALVEGSRASSASDTLQLFATGRTSSLENIFIATDGFYRMTREIPQELRAFITDTVPPSNNRGGVDFLLQDFRKAIAWNPQVQAPLDDEATFAVLRRLEGGEEDVIDKPI